VLYLQGKGVSKDTTQAAQWFRRAADNGDLGAEVEFAIRLFSAAARKLARAAARSAGLSLASWIRARL
jgi:TPR repeat protein